MRDCMATNRKFRWLETLKPGDEVCDCRFKHIKIASIDLRNSIVILEDGASCSPLHCLDPVDHEEKHPEGY